MDEIITKNRHWGSANLDPRLKMLFLILIGLVSYYIVGEVAGFLLMLGFGIFISIGNGMKWAVKMVIIYIGVSYLNALLKYVSIPGISVIMSVFGVTILKMLPLVMVGRWVMFTTYMDDMMVAFQRMRLPHSVTIPLIVMFRYIPTLRIEYGMIRNTMEIRGICDTWGKRVLHPVLTIEYILIPLLMRCLKIADELAASGATRGLEREVKRYSLNDICFSWKEYIVLVIAIVLLILLLLSEETYIGEIILWRV